MRIVRTDERQLAKDLKGGLSIAANADCDDFARDRSLELIRSPLRDDQTVVDDGQLIAQRVSLFQVMSRQKYRRAPFTQAFLTTHYLEEAHSLGPQLAFVPHSPALPWQQLERLRAGDTTAFPT